MTFKLHTRRAAVLAATFGAWAIATPVAAQDNMEIVVKARQGAMEILQLNLGVLGNMAKGTVPYDAEVASAAAADFAAVSGLNHAAYWPEGSDADSIEGTRALASAWADGSDFLQIFEQLETASLALADAAGNGAEALGPAIGPVGQACGSCHRAHRARAN